MVAPTVRDAVLVTWELVGREALLERTGCDAFLRWTTAPDSLLAVGEHGWAALLRWRPHGHWGGGAVVGAEAPEGAESEALALLAARAAASEVQAEWFSTVPGRSLEAPAGMRLGGSGRWAFLSTTSAQDLPGALPGLVELDDVADAELIEAFARAHNPDFEGFPGRGFASVWLAVRDGDGLAAVGALHTLGSGAPHLSGLVVRTDLRGRGLGAALTGELTCPRCVQDVSPVRAGRVPGQRMAAEIERRLGLHAAGVMLPFVVRRAGSGEVVGMTTFMNVDEPNRRLEIGSTWLAASAQGTGINAEAKLLLLTHAFETLGCNAVELRTHWLNHRSRQAIERLGAKLDGILRQHMVMADGSVRDTAVYSVVAAEWPAVRAELRRRLSAHAARTDQAPPTDEAARAPHTPDQPGGAR